MFCQHGLLIRPPAGGGGGGGLIGQAAPQFFGVPGGASSYNLGTVVGVTAGDLILAHIHPLAQSGGGNSSGIAATLGGVSLGTPVVHTGTSSTIVPTPAAFAAVAGATGNLALATTLGFSARCCAAVVWIIQGFAASPIGQTFGPTSWASDSGSLAVPGGGLTTGADGNAYVASVGIKGGDVTVSGFADMDGFTYGKSGTNAFQDITVGYGWVTKATAAAIAPVCSWSPSDRSAGLGVELVAA